MVIPNGRIYLGKSCNGWCNMMYSNFAWDGLLNLSLKGFKGRFVASTFGYTSRPWNEL